VAVHPGGARVAEEPAPLARRADRDFFGVLGSREEKFVKRLRKLVGSVAARDERRGTSGEGRACSATPRAEPFRRA
jgi:hypothetical protein